MDELDEKVLDIAQRQKRALIMRRYKAKIERSRELAKKRIAPEKNIKKRAYAQARQIVRRRVAGKRGAEYEKLGPSEKMAIDRAIEGKQALIKKIALRLIPRVKQAEQQRLSAFMKGQALKNHGQAEGGVKEEFNAFFAENFPPMAERSDRKQPKETTDTVARKKGGKEAKGNSNIIQYSKFGEERDCDSSAYRALAKKARKSGISEDILGEVYDRGMDAWYEETGVSQQQYAFARVNSFINQGKSYFNEDADLHELSLDTLSNYIDKASDARGHRKLSTKKVDNRYKGVALAQKKGNAQAAKEGPKKLKPVKTDYERQMDVSHRRIYNEAFKNWAVEEGTMKPYVKPHYGDPNNPDKQTGWKSANKHGKTKFWQSFAKPSAMKHAGITEEEVQQTNENFIDGKGPGKPGDAARHGLKGKSATQLRKIRSSETASPRKKQLAHWMLNMHHNEAVDEGLKDPKDNPCWDGYKPVGTKKLRGKTVPNCVPESVNEGVNLNSDHYKALTDIELNTKNRDMTTQNDGYGPLNPLDEKGSKKFWDEKAKMWKTTIEAAKEARCGNCAFFNQSPPVMKKIADGIGERGETVSELAGFGFCELWEFKCAALRTCNTWVLGGPIKEEKLGNSQPDPKKRLIGTDSLTKAYKKDTPGQSLDESFNIAFAAGVALTAGDLGMKAQGGFALHPSVIEELERRAAEQEDVEEEVKTADIKAEVIPAHTKTVVDPRTGAMTQTTVPGHVRRAKKNKTIIPSGNVNDGK